MSGVFAEHDPAATPLTPEEMRDLIPTYIAYRRELNAAEQEHCPRAGVGPGPPAADLLSEKFIKDLHRRMLCDVWRWAGRFRASQNNIGIDYWLIPTEVRQLLDDAKAWIGFSTYPPDELAVRFHHRLVLIHPFPNGNGRHARLLADLLVMSLDRERFSWGRESLRDPGAARRRYIEALHAADNHDMGPLLAFARA